MNNGQIVREALELALREHNELMRDADLPTGSNKIDAALAALSSLVAENERMREALAPFAAMAKVIGPSRPLMPRSESIVYGFDNAMLTIGDFQRALAASEPKEDKS